jgi:hypothetical protein
MIFPSAWSRTGFSKTESSAQVRPIEVPTNPAAKEEVSTHRATAEPTQRIGDTPSVLSIDGPTGQQSGCQATEQRMRSGQRIVQSSLPKPRDFGRINTIDLAFVESTRSVGRDRIVEAKLPRS